MWFSDQCFAALLPALCWNFSMEKATGRPHLDRGLPPALHSLRKLPTSPTILGKELIPPLPLNAAGPRPGQAAP